MSDNRSPKRNFSVVEIVSSPINPHSTDVENSACLLSDEESQTIEYLIRSLKLLSPRIQFQYNNHGGTFFFLVFLPWIESTVILQHPYCIF